MSHKNSNSNSFSFKKKPIKYRESDPIEELMNLYDEDNEDGDKTNNQNMETTLKKVIENRRTIRKRNFLITSITFLLILAGSAAAGFFYFNQNKPYSKENLKLEIIAPEKITIGKTFDYVIKYENEGDIELQETRLTVQYPEGFILEKTEPELSNHNWNLGSLQKFDNGEIKITGKIIAPRENEQTLIAIVDFHPINFNSNFQKEQKFSSYLETPEIEFINTYPANASLGQKINLTLKLKNKSEIDLNNVKLTLTTPEKFNILSSKPKSFEDNNKWILPTMVQQTESDKVEIEGSFPVEMKFENNEARLQKFNLIVEILGKDEQFIKISENEFTVNIIDQAISNHLIINGSIENRNIQLGDKLTYSIVIKNNSEQEYKNITIKSIISPNTIDIFNWEKLDETSLGKIGKTDKGKEIVWTKQELPDLALFDPDKEIIINFSLPTKTFSELALTKEQLAKTTIDSYVQIILSPETNADTLPIESSHIILTLNTDLNLTSKALYYYEDGTPIGEGPIPLQSNKTTKLHVFWDITNHIHPLENITVTTTIPEYVTLTDTTNVSTGELKYDSTKREISWTISGLPTSVNDAQAHFAIEVTPTQKQIGEIIKLTGITTLSAKDQSTNDLIIKTNNIITSALENDLNVTEDGVVSQ